MGVARLADKDQDSEAGNDADRQVDVEDPAPAVILGQPAAQHRAEDRPQHDPHAPDRDGLAVPFRRVDLHQHRLRQRHEPGAACALQQAIDHQLREACGAAAQGRGEGEPGHRDQKHIFDAEAPGEPAGQRRHDRHRDNVRGQHPGDLVLSRREAALNVRQRDIGDRVVDTLHDRRQHDRSRDHAAVCHRRPCRAPHLPLSANATTVPYR